MSSIENKEKKENELIHTMQIVAENVDNTSGIGEPKTGYLEYINIVPLILFSTFLNTNKIEDIKTPLSIFYKLVLILCLAIVYILCIAPSIIPYYYSNPNFIYIITSISWWFLMFFVIIIISNIKPIFSISQNKHLSRIWSR